MLRRCGIASLFVFAVSLAVSGRGYLRKPSQPRQQLWTSRHSARELARRFQTSTCQTSKGRFDRCQSAMGPKGAMLVFFRSADW